MSWLYRQSTGVFSLNGVVMAHGYSGHGEGLNNPDMQTVQGVGPIPRGEYVIYPPKFPVDHLGPLALPLAPGRDNVMFGRSAFFIHGDNAELNQTASDGCIILPHAIRQAISASRDAVLTVVQ